MPRAAAKTRTFAAILALALPMVVAVPAVQAQDQVPVDQKAASVDGRTVTVGDVQSLVQSLPQQFQQMPFQMLYPALLERAIAGDAISNAGVKAGLADDPRVAAQVRRFQNQLVREIYLSDLVEAAMTEETLKAKYAEWKDAEGSKEEVKARHILLEDEAAAQAVIAELEKGGDFQALAKEKSTGPSGPNGGDLGWFDHGQMVPEFADAAFALEPGSYTKAPVQSQFGWHVILVEDKRKAEPAPYEQVLDQMRQLVAEDVINKTATDLINAAEIERFKLDGSPMPAPEAQ